MGRAYIMILRLEKEREELRAKREQEERERQLAKAHFEYEVGKKFLGKIMAKRKAKEGAPPPNPLESADLAEKPKENTEGFSGCITVNPLDDGSEPKTPVRAQRPELLPPPIPRADRMWAPPPEPTPTPTIVCPAGFKNMKFVNTFTLNFTPPECCGGPRDVEIQSTNCEKILCSGRINSDTEVFLQRLNDEKETEDILTYKFDPTNGEWAISFPEMDCIVAYLVKPKPASRISANQIYEIFTAEGYSNYFNLGIEMEKTGSPQTPDYVFRILNSNLATVGTVILLSNYKAASVTIDESLWPSQKAVILAAGVLVSWELVQDIRRRAAWVRVLGASGIILALLTVILLFIIYQFHRDD